MFKTTKLTPLLVALVFPLASYGVETECPLEGQAARFNCLSEKLAKAEKELKKTFSRALAMISSNDYSSLPKEKDVWKSESQKSHRDWMAYRDSECQIVRYTYGYGNGAEAAEVECVLDKTIERTKELHGIYGLPR